MTRASNTPATRRRRKKILKQAKGYFGSKRKLFKTAKEQVRNMLSALGQKPSEEKVNRIINMTKSAEKKKPQKPKKISLKKKK